MGGDLVYEGNWHKEFLVFLKIPYEYSCNSMLIDAELSLLVTRGSIFL